MFAAIPNPREIRRQRGLNQSDFWSRVGVTQSGGSRYESGRNMPKPVCELVRLVHVEQIDLAKINQEDQAVISYLKEVHPDLFKSLRKAMKASMVEITGTEFEQARQAAAGEQKQGEAA